MIALVHTPPHGGDVPGSDGAKSLLQYLDEAGQCRLILCRIASAWESSGNATSITCNIRPRTH